MAMKHNFVCPLPNGMHARPASAFEEVSRGFSSEVTLINQRTKRTADGKSVLAIISADIRHNDVCVLNISGPDECKAMASLSKFVDQILQHCDDVILPQPAQGRLWDLPPILHGANVEIYRGVPVVDGIARGRIVSHCAFKISEKLFPVGPTNGAQAEWLLLDDALQKLIVRYDRQMTSARKRTEIELLKAHRAVARDPGLRHQLREAVMCHNRSAAGAIVDTEAHFSTMLAATDSVLLRERVVDIQDVCLQLFHQLYGRVHEETETQLNNDAILVAETLTPSRFLALDRRFLKGLVIARGSMTSHTVILARSFGIPTLVSVSDLSVTRLDGEEAVLDCTGGVLVTTLTDPIKRYYKMEERRLIQRELYTRRFVGRTAHTLDKQRIRITANVSSLDEASAAFKAGAEGIGLFRTETLFLNRETATHEAQQYEAYKRILEAAQGRTVVIRTVDIGGDKPLSFLNLPLEENPFLGCRGVRIYPMFESIFRTQIRALLRASAYGALKVLIPMVTTVDEVRWVKRIIKEEREKCIREHVKFDSALQIGAMIEVPAAAFALDTLCDELEFFSIGSNDLLQYFAAADRMDTRLDGLYNPFQPAFLRLLDRIVNDIHAHGKRVGLCGEIGAQRRFLPLLVGLGLDEISTSVSVITDVKAQLVLLASQDCRRLFAKAQACASADEVATLLGTFTPRHGDPLLDPESIVVNSDALTKAEAIKEAVDRLYVLGRVEDTRAVEKAVWQREHSYSTGFGHGFAIPHCKTNAVKSHSLVLLKLRNPVSWESIDGQSVSVVILLAVQESYSTKEHMRILAKLARLVMDDQFRVHLEQENDANRLFNYLSESLQPDLHIPICT